MGTLGQGEEIARDISLLALSLPVVVIYQMRHYAACPSERQMASRQWKKDLCASERKDSPI